MFDWLSRMFEPKAVDRIAGQPWSGIWGRTSYTIDCAAKPKKKRPAKKEKSTTPRKEKKKPKKKVVSCR